MDLLRGIGIMLIVSSLILAALMFSFVQTLSEMSEESCTCGDSCEMVHFEIPFTFYLGLAAVITLIVCGLYLALIGPPVQSSADRSHWKERIETLKKEEKDIYKLLIDEDGTMFQSDIVEQTGLSKVKVTRTLDKLEAKGWLERRRRGLTNIIVLT